MKVNSISFGRAIKVNGSEKIARRIVSSVNYKQYSPASKALESFSSSIFHDANIRGGRAEMYQINSDNYIFTGEEAIKAREIVMAADYQILKNKADAKRAAKTEEEKVRFDMMAKHENRKIEKSKNDALLKMVEDGTDSKKKTVIDVETCCDAEFEDGKPHLVTRIVYSSQSPHIKETSIFAFNEEDKVLNNM